MILSCQSGVAVTPGDQRRAFGSMSFSAYGSNAAQGVGQMYYDIYISPGSTCGSTARIGVGGTPNPTIYVGLTPTCGTTMTQDCPVVQGPPSPPQSPTNPSLPGNPPGPTGRGPTGSGPTGAGPSGGSSSGSTALTQNDSQNTLPSSSAQGDRKQVYIEPSPFFDGKQYASGSSSSAPLSISKTGSSLFNNWTAAILGTLLMAGATAAGVYYWYSQKRNLKSNKMKRSK